MTEGAKISSEYAIVAKINVEDIFNGKVNECQWDTVDSVLHSTDWIADLNFDYVINMLRLISHLSLCAM